MCERQLGELLLMDKLSLSGRVTRTGNYDPYDPVDILHEPFVQLSEPFFTEASQIPKSIKCQCKTCVPYHKENCWTVPFNKTWLGIERFLKADKSYIVIVEQSINSWENEFDGWIIKILTNQLSDKFVTEVNGSKCLKIPRTRSYAIKRWKLTEQENAMLRILSSSEYTY